MADDQQLQESRRSYEAGSLVEADLEGEDLRDPLRVVRRWLAEAQEADLLEPTAMTLSTLGVDGPDARVVLCKGLDGGVVWYSNRGSVKGRQLQRDERAAVTFHWPELERQVRARGTVEPLDDDASDAYFATRPRESQLGAWASGRQSEPVLDRATLEEEYAAVEARFEGRDVPRPDTWGGYRLVPAEVELWQGRPGRLHDRLLLTSPGPQGGDWFLARLRP